MKRPDGRGGWSASSATPGGALPAARTVAAVQAGQPVYVVEGEKDADRLAAMGLAATCNFDGAAAAGARTKWRPEYGDLLREADVTIIRDRDDRRGGACSRGSRRPRPARQRA